jgi:hypothetical protein
MVKIKDEAKWGKQKAQQEVSNRGQLKGLGSKDNINRWSDYAAKNSYDPRGSIGKAQDRHDLSNAGASRDINEGSEGGVQRQHAPEGDRGWAKIDSVTARNTYTGRDGSKRHDDR